MNVTGSTATIYVGSDGKEIITIWNEWEPTAELRYTRPPHTTTKADRLQQRFFRTGLNSAGHVATKEYDWRDVPVVIIPTY